MRSRAAALTLVAVLAGAAAGCGQTGPLELPDSARPIEPATAPVPEQTEDERRNER